MIVLARTLAAALASLFILAGSASAQMGSEPFSFRNGSGGVGISPAGKQALILKKLFNFTPDVPLRGPDGNLLFVFQGPNHSAIVVSPTGGLLPSYRGRGWKKSNPALRVDGFNPYFAALHQSQRPLPAASATNAAIDNWTGKVIQGGPTGVGGSSVDQWTDMVHYLN